MSREANDLADQLQDDPIIAEDLAIPGFSAGDTGRSEEMGTVIVDRTYSGPDRPLQTILQDRVEEAGWLAIGVRCRNDGRGFTLRARRAVDGHVALLTMTVYDEGDGRKIGIEVTSRLERRTYRDGDPKPIEQCE